MLIQKLAILRIAIFKGLIIIKSKGFALISFFIILINWERLIII